MAPKKVAKGRKGARGNNNNNNNAQADRNNNNNNVDGNNAGAQGNEGANNNRNNNGAQQNQNQDNNNNNNNANNAAGNNAVGQQNDGGDNANNNGNAQQLEGENNNNNNNNVQQDGNNNNNNNNDNDLVLLNAVTAPACMKENGKFKEFFPLRDFAGDANETVEIQVYFASIMSTYTFFKPGVLRFFTLKFMHRQALEAVRAYTRRTPCITHHIANTEVRDLTYVCFVFYQLSPEPVWLQEYVAAIRALSDEDYNALRRDCFVQNSLFPRGSTTHYDTNWADVKKKIQESYKDATEINYTYEERPAGEENADGTNNNQQEQTEGPQHVVEGDTNNNAIGNTNDNEIVIFQSNNNARVNNNNNNNNNNDGNPRAVGAINDNEGNRVTAVVKAPEPYYRADVVGFQECAQDMLIEGREILLQSEGGLVTVDIRGLGEVCKGVAPVEMASLDRVLNHLFEHIHPLVDPKGRKWNDSSLEGKIRERKEKFIGPCLNFYFAAVLPVYVMNYISQQVEEENDRRKKKNQVQHDVPAKVREELEEALGGLKDGAEGVLKKVRERGGYVIRDGLWTYLYGSTKMWYNVWCRDEGGDAQVNSVQAVKSAQLLYKRVGQTLMLFVGSYETGVIVNPTGRLAILLSIIRSNFHHTAERVTHLRQELTKKFVWHPVLSDQFARFVNAYYNLLEVKGLDECASQEDLETSLGCFDTTILACPDKLRQEVRRKYVLHDLFILALAGAWMCEEWQGVTKRGELGAVNRTASLMCNQLRDQGALLEICLHETPLTTGMKKEETAILRSLAGNDTTTATVPPHFNDPLHALRTVPSAYGRYNSGEIQVSASTPEDAQEQRSLFYKIYMDMTYDRSCGVSQDTALGSGKGPGVPVSHASKNQGEKTGGQKGKKGSGFGKKGGLNADGIRGRDGNDGGNTPFNNAGSYNNNNRQANRGGFNGQRFQGFNNNNINNNTNLNCDFHLNPSNDPNAFSVIRRHDTKDCFYGSEGIVQVYDSATGNWGVDLAKTNTKRRELQKDDLTEVDAKGKRDGIKSANSRGRGRGFGGGRGGRGGQFTQDHTARDDGNYTGGRGGGFGRGRGYGFGGRGRGFGNAHGRGY